MGVMKPTKSGITWYRLSKKLQKKITLPRKEWKAEVERLFATMLPVEGEQRAIVVCCDCGQFIGRRYIPYGLGRGVTMNPCLCQLTAHRPTATLAEMDP